MQVNITKLIDDVQCYQTVRELRWPDGVQCPSCESQPDSYPQSRERKVEQKKEQIF